MRFFNLTVVVVEWRKPKDWEPPRPPPIISPMVQAKIDAVFHGVEANKAALAQIAAKGKK